MTDRELMQQALDALEKHAMQRTYAGGVYIANVAIALRDRLAQPEQKPLSNGEIYTAYITATNQTLRAQDERLAFAFARAIEAKLKEKNNG